MSAFSHLRIAHKILAGFALLALLSLFIGGFGAFQLSMMAERSRALVDEQAESVKLAALANENKSRMHQIWYATVIENDLPDFRNQLAVIAGERRELDSRLKALRPFMGGVNSKRFAKLERGLADYYKATEAVPAMWMAGRKEDAEDVIQHPAREAYEVIDEALGGIVQHQDEALETGLPLLTPSPSLPCGPSSSSRSSASPLSAPAWC